MIKYFDKNAARINLIKFSAIFALVVFSPIDVSAGPSACGNIDNQYYGGEDPTFTCGNGYDVSSEFEFTDPKGRSCTSSPTVDYSIARAKLTSSDADTYRLYLIEKPHEWDGGWADIDFQCSYGGCDGYDRMWSGSGTHDIEINNESDGGIKSQYWMAYFQDSTGNGCARWDGESFNEYSHVNFHPEVSGPSPSNGGNNVGVSPDLQVDVSDAEGDYTDVEFYNANGDSSLGIDNWIPDGGTASETWFDVDEYSTEYSWYVRWDQNDGHTEQSNTYSFTTEANAAFSYGPSFPVGGTLINFDASGTSNGDGISSYEWDWDDDGTYEASGISASHSYSSKGDQTVTLKVTDTYGQTDTVTKTVSVGEQNQHPNQASVVEPADGATVYGESVEIEAEVSDPDGDSLDVEFFNNVSNLSSSERTVSGVNSGESTSVTVDNINRGRSYRWWVKTSDSWESTKGGSWTFYNNELPSVSNPSPPDDGVAVNQDVSISILPEDKESTAGNELRAYFYEGNGVFIQEIDATNGDTVSIEYPNTEIGETYEWYVKLSDGYENYTSSVFEFEKTTTGQYRVEPSIDYKYSDILIAQDGSEEFFFEVQNRISDSKDLKTYISGANATFRDNNQDSISYSLDGYETRSFLVRIDPETTGDKTLALITENQQFGVNTTTEIPVTVKNYNDVSQTSEVPGIGFLQMVVILAISSTVYLARIQ